MTNLLQPNLEIVLAAAFGAVASVLVFGLFLVRDLFANRGQHTPAISRLPEPPRGRSNGLAGRIDHAFEGLIAESGVSLREWDACLLLLLVGIGAGGGVFAVSDLPWVGAASAVAAMAIVLAIWSWMRARRLQRIYRELPNLLDSLVRGVSAGESVESSIASAAQVVEGPLAVEMRRCGKQLTLGLSLPRALAGLRRRVNIPELAMLTAAVSVHRHTGGNLVEVLRGLSAIARQRHSQRRQFWAATAGARFSTLLVAISVPAYLAFAMFYEYDYGGYFFRDPMGIACFTAASVLLLTGLIWSHRTLRVQL